MFRQLLAVLPADRPRLVYLLMTGCLLATPVRADEPQAPSSSVGQETDNESQAAWRALFDGKTLDGWKVSAFGGQGDVYVEDGRLLFEFGSPLTGITYAGEQALPRSNYELRLVAQRIAGTDFFCCLTFPVKEEYCSLVVGGWGGALVGLSSVDGNDAARNDTQQFLSFRREQWYAIRVRVSDDAIEAWIDGKRIIRQPLAGHEISIRPEVRLSCPLGISSFETRAAIRSVELRELAVADDADQTTDR